MKTTFGVKCAQICLLLIVVFNLTIPVFPSSKSASDQIRLNLLITSDLHGWLTTNGYRTTRKASGLLHLIPIINQERNDDPDTILIDAGDLIQGSPLSHYAHHVSSNLLEDDIFFQEFNRLSYDAVVVGNHDLDTNPLLEDVYQPASKFTWLAANLMRENKLVFSPFQIITRKNVKTLIIGFTTPGGQIWSDQQKLNGIQIEDISSSVEKWLKYINQNIEFDLIIGVFHSGLNPFRDNENSKLNRVALANETLRVIQNSSRFNLVITGHDHRLNPTKPNRSIRYIKGTPVISGGKHGEALVKVSFLLKPKGNGLTVDSIHAKPIYAHQDASISSSYQKLLTKNYKQYIEEKLPWQVSQIASSKKLSKCFNYLMSLLQTSEQTAITAFPSVRIKSSIDYSGKQLTRKHLFNIIPYSNRTVHLNLSKRDLQLISRPPPEFGFKRVPYNRKLLIIGASKEEIPKLPNFLSKNQFIRQIPVLITDYHYQGGGGLIPMLQLAKEDLISTKETFQRDDLFSYLKNGTPLPAICKCLVPRPIGR